MTNTRTRFFFRRVPTVLVPFVLLFVLAVMQGSNALADRAISEVKERAWGFKKTPVELQEVTKGVWRTTGVSNAYVVQTSDGAVVIDTGILHQAPRVMELLESAVSGPVRAVILTHAHMDHVSGANMWLTKYPDAELITHEAFPQMQYELKALGPYYGARGAKILPTLVAMSAKTREKNKGKFQSALTPDILIDNDSPRDYKVGDSTFRLIGAPAGEGPDGLVVWLPQKEMLFSGDMTGPHFPMFPNLYSIRGERYREFMPYINSLTMAIALEPEIVAHGHFDVIHGKAYIRKAMTRMRDAVQYVHDATIAGMNEGKSLPELMREIQLPPHLELSQGYGKVAWSVRGLWETYTGWFDFESPTSLYPVPVREVYADLLQLAGGADAVLAAAEKRLARSEPVHALHLIEVAEASATDGQSRKLVTLKRRALQAIRAHAVENGNNFMEVSLIDAQLAELGVPGD